MRRQGRGPERASSTSRRSVLAKLKQPRPRVEPNYKREKRSWSVVSLVASLVLLILASVVSDGEIMALVMLSSLISIILAALSTAVKGSYDLAVEFVNSTEVEEWAYNNGVAVMALPGGAVAVLDTRAGEVYLTRDYSLQRYPLIDSGGVKFRAFAFATRAIDLRGFEGRKAEVLRGFVECPSIKSEREWMRVSGTFLRAKLKDKDKGAQVRRLIEGLKEV